MPSSCLFISHSCTMVGKISRLGSVSLLASRHEKGGQLWNTSSAAIAYGSNTASGTCSVLLKWGRMINSSWWVGNALGSIRIPRIVSPM